MITLSETMDAHSLLPRDLKDRPVAKLGPLAETAPADVLLKLECLNPIGTFKARGGWMAVKELAGMPARGESATRGIACTTTGNFGLGLAFAARKFRYGCDVFVAQAANPLKIEKMRRLGATIHQSTAPYYETEELAKAYARDNGLAYLADGELRGMAVGASTIGFEITRDILDPLEHGEQAVIVPVGDGSLIGGIGSWIRQAAPSIAVIGVQSEMAPAATYSHRQGRPVEEEPRPTIAEGIGTRSLSAPSFEMIRAVVDEMVLVSETSIRSARAALQFETGMTIEYASAATFAAARELGGRYRRLVLIMTGSNLPNV